MEGEDYDNGEGEESEQSQSDNMTPEKGRHLVAKPNQVNNF